ncbi:MAG TPA: hypothetical protein VG815_10840 [Chloroflexota bacterium]|nr:hypothetical protein [Chloroflexota bacterium]
MFEREMWALFTVNDGALPEGIPLNVIPDAIYLTRLNRAERRGGALGHLD